MPRENCRPNVFYDCVICGKAVARYVTPYPQDNRPENLAHFPNNAEHKRHENTERARSKAGHFLPIGVTA
jgi:hypothetical protein